MRLEERAALAGGRMTNPLLPFLTRLKQAGLKLDTIYDIGAHKGLWSLQVKEVLPEAKFFLFEANPVWKADLEATGMDHFITCLSDESRSVAFFDAPTCGASYYREATTFFDGVPTVMTKTATLDAMALRHDLAPPDMLKLDVQGAELDVLAGAVKALETITLIQCELPLVRYNLGAPEIGEYLEWFRDNDFLPVLPLEHTSLEDVFVHMDFLFMRKDAKDKYLSPTERLRL